MGDQYPSHVISFELGYMGFDIHCNNLYVPDTHTSR